MQRKASARQTYRFYVETGVSAGCRTELGGGGRIRREGGWDTVKKLRKPRVRPKGAEPVLADTEFGVQFLENANERLSRQSTLHAWGMDFNGVVARVGKRLVLDVEAVVCTDKTPQSVLARCLLCHFAYKKLGLSAVDIARRLKINQSLVSPSARQCRGIARDLKSALIVSNACKHRRPINP